MRCFESLECCGKNRVAALAVVAMLAGSLSHANASIWTEEGDADDLPGTAQITVGLGPLDAISGTIDNSAFEDIDMFAIHITDPANFSASLFSDPLFGLLDTYLFLFDDDGKGVVADNDASFLPGPGDPISEIPSGSMAGHEPGLYYLAVATGFAVMEGDLPTDGTDFIFDPFELALDDSSGTVAPMSSAPIVDWNLDFDVLDEGGYEIQLTGSDPAVIPEQSSLVLWGMVILVVVGLVFARRRWGSYNTA